MQEDEFITQHIAEKMEHMKNCLKTATITGSCGRVREKARGGWGRGGGGVLCARRGGGRLCGLPHTCEALEGCTRKRERAHRAG